jgi:sialate O-acetylesterase
MRRLAAVLPCFFLLALPGLASAQGLRLPSIFGDHMVVQAGRRVSVWGHDLPGTRVLVRVSPDAQAGGQAQGLAPVEEAQALADASGRWALTLGALPPGGPYQLELRGSGTLVLHDVLAGEVWLGSGQSNMDMPMRATQDADAELARATIPPLRFFTVEWSPALAPAEDLQGRWQVCSPASARPFSGLAYYFGKELQAALGRPVGMIVSSWGGTPAELWTPRPALDAWPAVAPLLRKWDRSPGVAQAVLRGLPHHIEVSGLRLVDADGAASRAAGAGTVLPLQGWSHWEGPLSSGSLTSTASGLLYQGWVQGPRFCWAGLELRPRWGWGQGQDLRACHFVALRARGAGDYAVTLYQPARPEAGGPSQTVAFQSRFFHVGPQWRDVWIPMDGFYHRGWEDQAEFDPSHVTRIAVTAAPPQAPQLGGVLYNAMIAPLRRFPLRGVLWNQGESNAPRVGHYAALLRLLVLSWRRAWGDDLEFLTAQLPRLSADARWPLLRAAQAQAMAGLPNTGLAVTLDAGESHELHPRDKRTVGHRLALIALAKAYGRPLESSGPTVAAVTAEPGRLRIRLDHARGLALRVPAPASFEVAGADGVFHRCGARVDGSSLLLADPAVPRPRAARYAWRDDPEVDLYNGDGLPAGPFSVGVDH